MVRLDGFHAMVTHSRKKKKTNNQILSVLNAKHLE